MRIISGEAKGVKLKTLNGMDTRPTSDKVKESIFNIIAPYIGESRVLDLFSGTGNLGIEAVSRGAEYAYLIEKNRRCQPIIKENISKAKLGDRIKLIIKDAVAALKMFSTNDEKFDIIFMDPPYLKGFILPCIEEISDLNLLNIDGIIVIEHDIKDILPDTVKDIIKFKEKKYGTTMVSFYCKEE